MDKQLQSRFRLMLENAGYSVPPGRAVCAIEMARASLLLDRAVDAGVASIEWIYDDEPYDPGDLYTEAETAAKFESNEWTGPFGCVIYFEPNESTRYSVAGLWGIVVGQWGTNDPYCRVIEAGLASEIEDDLRQVLGDALDAEREASLI